jgi:hypothetical protein
MKLFKIFAGIMGFFALVFVVSLFFPRTYKIEKTTVINMPDHETFAYLNNIRNWADWSPWNTDLDSSMVFFLSKVTEGKGAAQYFRGGLVGNGRFRIVESVPNESIAYNLYIDMDNGSYMSISQKFVLKSLGGKTQLSWVDEGDVGMNPLYRFLLPSKIKSTEQGFEEGLAVIKKSAENRKLQMMQPLLQKLD